MRPAAASGWLSSSKSGSHAGALLGCGKPSFPATPVLLAPLLPSGRPACQPACLLVCARPSRNRCQVQNTHGTIASETILCGPVTPPLPDRRRGRDQPPGTNRRLCLPCSPICPGYVIADLCVLGTSLRSGLAPIPFLIHDPSSRMSPRVLVLCGRPSSISPGLFDPSPCWRGTDRGMQS